MTRSAFQLIWHSTSDCICLFCICRIDVPVVSPGLRDRFEQSEPYPP
jgi:hypothetical protein